MIDKYCYNCDELASDCSCGIPQCNPHKVIEALRCELSERDRETTKKWLLTRHNEEGIQYDKIHLIIEAVAAAADRNGVLIFYAADHTQVAAFNKDVWVSFVDMGVESPALVPVDPQDEETS